MRYVDPALGYSFELPDGWQKDDERSDGLPFGRRVFRCGDSTIEIMVGEPDKALVDLHARRKWCERYVSGRLDFPKFEDLYYNLANDAFHGGPFGGNIVVGQSSRFVIISAIDKSMLYNIVCEGPLDIGGSDAIVSLLRSFSGIRRDFLRSFTEANLPDSPIRDALLRRLSGAPSAEDNPVDERPSDGARWWQFWRRR